ncbi:DUF1428 domain-containing protein [Candidatus Woesebacteria bacterium]|nr:DUF1428 domain-containing protein [Candidatus Woesebacteria bacterium]
MAKYVDGFILVVPNDKAEEYKKMAESGRDSWMKHGAIGYFECRGDDMAPQKMESESTRPFPEMAGASSTETVWFSFIIFNSKVDRDRVNAKVMAEMGAQMQEYQNVPMPFTMNKMAYGGFQVEVEG